MNEKFISDLLPDTGISQEMEALLSSTLSKARFMGLAVPNF